MSLIRGPHGLRARVTLWYTSLLVLALVAYAAVVFMSLRRVLWAELDDRLHHEIETVEGLLQPYWTPDGPSVPGGGSPLDDDDYRWVQVWSPDNRLLFESDVARANPLGLPPPSADAATSLVLASGERLRVKEERGHIARHPVTVRAATSEERLRSELADMLVAMFVALALCAAAAAYGGHRLGRRMLSPVTRLVDAANQITPADLSARLPVETPDDEIGQLARAFNETLTRVDGAFAQMQRFTVNASHELRTPLTALQSTGQVALTDAETATEYRDAIGSMLEEAQHLSRLIETLLLLARSDAGQVTLTRQSTNLLDLVRAVVGECAILADEKQQRIAVEGTDAVASVDPTVLRIALANVVHNAIRYSPDGGEIRIAVSASPALVHVTVEDSGPGIPAEHLDLIFERFYRIDPARSTESGGVGLGLSMARWAVTVHGGSIRASHREPAGTTFTISLPASPEKS